jgi:hypothetical protein
MNSTPGGSLGFIYLPALSMVVARLLLLSLLACLRFHTVAQPTLTPTQWREDLQAALDSLLLD